MKKIAALLLVAVMMFSLAACGGSGGVEGTYHFVKMSAGGMEMSADDVKALAEATGQKLDLDELFKLEIKSDGTFTMTANADTQSGTYELNGDTLTMTIEGQSVDCTYKSGTITMSVEGSELVFEK